MTFLIVNDKDQNSNKELEAVAQDPSFITTTHIEKNSNTEKRIKKFLKYLI